MASAWFPVEFHAYAYGGVTGRERTVFLQSGLDNLKLAGFQRFVHGEDGFGVFVVHLGDDVVAPFRFDAREADCVEGIVGWNGVGDEILVDSLCPDHRVEAGRIGAVVHLELGCHAFYKSPEFCGLHLALVDDHHS